MLRVDAREFPHYLGEMTYFCEKRYWAYEHNISSGVFMPEQTYVAAFFHDLYASRYFHYVLKIRSLNIFGTMSHINFIAEFAALSFLRSTPCRITLVPYQHSIRSFPYAIK